MGLTAVVRLGSGRAGLTKGKASFEASTPKLVATASIAWILAVTAAAATAEALKEKKELNTRALILICETRQGVEPGHGLRDTPSTKVSISRWCYCSTNSEELATKVKQVHAADCLLNQMNH